MRKPLPRQIAAAVLEMANLWLDANVQFMTIMATKMPSSTAADRGARLRERDLALQTLCAWGWLENDGSIVNPIEVIAIRSHGRFDRTERCGTGGDPSSDAQKERGLVAGRVQRDLAVSGDAADDCLSQCASERV
jgi:hypothetical protein